MTGNALKQVRQHVDQAEKLSDQAAIAQLDSAARNALSGPALVQAIQALIATLA